MKTANPVGGVHAEVPENGHDRVLRRALLQKCPAGQERIVQVLRRGL
jgi:hypothetical protein